MSRETIWDSFDSDADIAAVLRGYVDRFELTSPMVKQMMLDAAAEIERLRGVELRALTFLNEQTDNNAAALRAALEPKL